MHLFAVWLAGYYDWWFAKTKLAPRRWIAAIVAIQFIILFASVQHQNFLWVYVVFCVAAAPAFFAASKAASITAREKEMQVSQLAKTQRLLKSRKFK